MKFGFFEGEQSKRHDVFLYHELCQIIPTDYLAAARKHLPLSHHMESCFVPSDAFLKWLADNDLDYMIHAIWPDGCSLFLIEPTEADLAMVKLSWDPLRCRT